MSQRLPENAVEVHGLGKTYAASGKTASKRALDNVDLTIPRGSLFGLLGPKRRGQIDTDQHPGRPGAKDRGKRLNLGL